MILKKCKKNSIPVAFSFELGEPVSILDNNYFNDLVCADHERYLNPPVNFHHISRLLLASTFHQSAIEVKKNILLSTIELCDETLLSEETLEGFIQDYLIYGNAYLQLIKNPFGEVIGSRSVLAKYVRKNKNNEFIFIQEGEELPLKNIFHFKNVDVNQNIYGVPSYLSAIQPLLLNESATLFRRKYYLNGAHAGSIIYANDSGLSRDDVQAIQKELSKTKGKGNFKNLFLYAPNGRADGLKVIPLSDSASKDEFLNIKNASRDDILSAHRVPPQLLSVVPNNTGGFGDTQKAARVFFVNEIKPLQRKLKRLNPLFNKTILQFSPYELLQEL